MAKQVVQKNKSVKEKTDIKIENIKELSLLQKLFNFQGEDIYIPKSKKAYGYKYAELDSIQEIIRPFLQKHRIGYYPQTIQTEEDKQSLVITTLFNPDGDDKIESKTFIDDQVKLSGMNKFMVIGSAITYFRRYHLVTMLGLTTDEDTDAGGAEKDTDNKTDSKSTVTIPKKSRSIDLAKQESSVDYIKIFDNLISKNKSIEQLNKMFDKYKKNMDAETSSKIKSSINNSNKQNENK